MVALLVLTLVSDPADAGSHPPTTTTAQAVPIPPPLNVRLDLTQHKAIQALQHKATSHPAARPATAPKARPAPEHQAQQAASRSAERPALAPTLAGARTYAQGRLSAAQYACLSHVVDRESGWNPYARNASSGAYGLFQALPGSKMASAGPDWASSPLTQMRWGISYMRSRYGSPCGAWYFWQRNGWY